MKTVFLTAIFITGLASSALAQNEQLKSDRDAVNNACSAEATTAGCGTEKVGTGLLKCLHAYKKAHKKDFSFSEGCKSAMKKLHADRQEKNK